MIGSDASALLPGSPLSNRLMAYGTPLLSLHVLILGRGSRGEDVQLSPGVYVHDRRSRSALWSLYHGPKAASALIAEQGIDLVSAQDPFEHGLVARLAIKGTSARLHLQVHTDFLSPWFVRGVRFPMSWRNRVRLRLARENIPAAHGIRTVSERIAARIREVYPHAVAPSVIPIAVDPTLPAPEPLGLEECRFMFMAVGRLEAEKRVDDLLKALAMVLTKYPHTCLSLVGDGRERRRLEKLARRSGISNNVRFLGTRPDARALMQSAHAFVQASAYEGYGLSLIEAALAHIPIVTTDVGIVGDVLRPIHDALVVPVGEPFELALAMIELIENNERRMKVARSAEVQVKAHLASQPDPVDAIVNDLIKCAGTAAR
jgi:glycosyltransferase involved in cell wall biosynthesis